MYSTLGSYVTIKAPYRLEKINHIFTWYLYEKCHYYHFIPKYSDNLTHYHTCRNIWRSPILPVDTSKNCLFYDYSRALWIVLICCVLYVWSTVLDLITAHTPISAQSSDFIVLKITGSVLFCLLLYKCICCGYSFELHRLVPTTYAFIKKIRKIA